MTVLWEVCCRWLTCAWFFFTFGTRFSIPLWRDPPEVDKKGLYRTPGLRIGAWLFLIFFLNGVWTRRGSFHSAGGYKWVMKRWRQQHLRCSVAVPRCHWGCPSWLLPRTGRMWVSSSPSSHLPNLHGALDTLRHGMLVGRHPNCSKVTP